MRKVFILILFCLIPLITVKHVFASTPNTAERYCHDNPHSRFNCQQIFCESRNSSRSFSNGIFGDKPNSPPITYEDCQKFSNGIPIPDSLKNGVFAELLFELLSRAPLLEMVVPVTLIAFLSTFFTSTIFSVLGFLFYSSYSLLLLILLIAICFTLAGFLLWKKRNK